jgi:hypothetical protein
LKKTNKKSKEPKSFESYVPTASQLTKLAKEWQYRLRLNDWDVIVEYAPPEGMSDAGVVGNCRCIQEHKNARLRLLHPKFYVGQAMTYSFRDFEHTLVHEFMHIHLDGLDIPKERMREEEQVINIVAGALVAAKYNLA